MSFYNLLKIITHQQMRHLFFSYTAMYITLRVQIQEGIWDQAYLKRGSPKVNTKQPKFIQPATVLLDICFCDKAGKSFLASWRLFLLLSCIIWSSRQGGSLVLVLWATSWKDIQISQISNPHTSFSTTWLWSLEMYKYTFFSHSVLKKNASLLFPGILIDGV